MPKIRLPHLRQIVRDVISNDARNYDIIPGLQHVYANNNNLIISVAWMLLISASFIITLYQTYDRIVYYFSYPVAIDYLFVERWDKDMYPETTVCASGDTENFVGVARKHEAQKHRDKEDRYCFGDLVHVTQFLNVTVEEFMTFVATKPVITEVKVKKLKGITRNISTDDLRSVYTPFGYCTTLNIRNLVDDAFTDETFSTKFKKPVDACSKSRIVMFMQNMDQPPSMGQVTSFGTGFYFKAIVDQRVYVFESRPNFPCSNTEDYYKCYDNCLVRMLKDNPNVTCKLPFSPQDIEYHKCTYENRTEVYQTMIGTMAVLSKTKATTDCNCPRACNQMTMTFVVEAENLDELTTIVAFKSTGYAMRMQERRTYGAITLFCDIGGNMGLFFGFSTLMIVKAVLVVAKSLKKKYEVKIRSKIASDEVYQKVILQYNRIKSKSSNLTSPDATTFVQKLFPNDKSNCVIFIKIIARALCFAICCFLIKNRIDYYISEPTRPFVSISLNTTVIFPDITICGKTVEILNLMEGINKANPGKFKDFCDVTLLDFIDYDTPELIWKHSNLSHNFVKRKELKVEEYYGIPIISSAVIDNVAMPEGLCTRFQPGEHPYTGFTTMFSVIGLFSQDCSNFQNVVYVSYHGLDVDMRHKLLLPLGVQTLTSVHMRRMVRLNKSQRQCEDFEKTTTCKRDCLHRKLLANIKCWLPYMPKLNITTCNTTQSAKEADQIYKNTYLKLNPYTGECGCVIPCIENYVTPYVASESQKEIDLVGINLFNFFTSMFETFVETEDYSFVKLLCDVGGMLGVGLGLCVLSIADFLHTVVVSIKRK